MCRTPTDEDHDQYLQIIKNKGIKTIVALSGHKDAQLKVRNVCEGERECNYCKTKMSQLMRLWYLSHMRPAKA